MTRQPNRHTSPAVHAAALNLLRALIKGLGKEVGAGWYPGFARCLPPCDLPQLLRGI